MSKIREMIEVMTEEEREDPDMVAAKPLVQRRIADASGNDIEAVQAMLSQFLAVRKQMQNLGQMMSAKDDLEALVGEDGLKNIKGLPSAQLQQLQGAVGRKVSKGKVLRKLMKNKQGSKKEARGFGKK